MAVLRPSVTFPTARSEVYNGSNRLTLSFPLCVLPSRCHVEGESMTTQAGRKHAPSSDSRRIGQAAEIGEAELGGAETLHIRLLGPLSLEWRGQGLDLAAPRLLGLLAYLAIEGPCSRETLSGLLWPGRGSHHLRQALYKLRVLPGASGWLQTGAVVQLRARTDLGDLWAQLRGGQLEEALGSLRAGGLLLGLELHDAPAFQDWLDGQRQTFAELYRQALHGELKRHAHDTDPGPARLAAQELLRLDPADEAVYRAWMRLEAQAGETERAKEVFEQCRVALRRELGAEPAPETLALLHELEGRSAVRDQPGWWVTLPGPGDAGPGEPGETEMLVGREAELGTALTLLEQRGRVLIHGLAGIGKTRLAQALGAELARRLAQQGGRVLWFHLGDDPPAVVLPALLASLGVRAGLERPLPALSAALHDAFVSQKVSALILDDAWNSYTVQTLQEALPRALRVVLTSRQRVGGWPRVALDRLARPEALELIRRSPVPRPPDDSDAGNIDPDEALDALCALLGDHPYALRLAALTLHSGTLGAADLLDALAQAPHRIGEHMGGGPSPAEAPGGTQSVAALLRHSVLRLDEEAHEAYLGLGSLPSSAVTPELLALLLRRSTPDTEEALYRLVERGLVSRVVKPGSDLSTFAMHDLTWHSARTAQAFLPGSALRAAALYAQAQSTHPEALALELPNLLGAARMAQQSGQPAALVQVMSGLLGGPYIMVNGFPPGHLPLLQAAGEAAVTLGDWPAAALLAGKLGDVYQALLGDADAGIEWYLSAREYAGRAGLIERQAIFSALAGGLMALQRRPESETILLEALSYAERSGNPLCTARVLEQNGVVRATQTNFQGARAALAEARKVLQPLLAPDHPRRIEAQSAYCNISSNLGQAEQRLGHLDNALSLKREALDIALERGESMRIARARSDIGELLNLLGEFEAAKGELVQAVDLYRMLGASGQEKATVALLTSLSF